ncbi:GGDEF domain-containing protein [Anaeromicropila herbilytica]|uniref:GGDEF domain-containing protein n=1 Tax=Anaeromicropila herbilytica TaxID=2785025 RepID=A0A7R7IEM4_9FIRM|nr:GGDEF domain-containing protein [Anaeromicropila herbilytica]BCN32166.1 hypothetical protein bsdtb5_34610 [Anaeromicropila herbilytica]
MDGIKDIVWNVLRRVKNKSLLKEYNALSPRLKKNIEIDLQFLNIKRVAIFILVFMLLPAFNIIAVIYEESELINYKIIINSIVLLILFIYLAVINLCITKNKSEKYQLLYLSFWIFFVIGFYGLSHLDMTVNQQLIIYIILFVSLCNVPILPSGEYKYIFSLQIVLIAVMVISGRHDSMLILNLIIISGTSYAFSRLNYNTYLDIQIKEKKLEEINSDLTELASRDSLTGLLNRRGLDEKLELLWPLCIRDQQSAVIIMLDIDYFKKYNDRYGHAEGDRCLREVADAIKKAAKRKTDVIARIGGEEFLVFAHNADSVQALQLAMEIKQNVEEIELNTINSNEIIKVTVSIGIETMVPEREDNFLDLYIKADTALYEAKETGRNCIIMCNKMY